MTGSPTPRPWTFTPHSLSAAYLDQTLTHQIAKCGWPYVLKGVGESMDGIYFSPEDVADYKHQRYREAGKERMTVVGKVKFYDVVVSNSNSNSDANENDDGGTRAQAAWEVVAPAPGFEILQGWLGFRITYSGDSGFGLTKTGPEGGVALDESWFG